MATGPVHLLVGTRHEAMSAAYLGLSGPLGGTRRGEPGAPPDGSLESLIVITVSWCAPTTTTATTERSTASRSASSIALPTRSPT